MLLVLFNNIWSSQPGRARHIIGLPLPLHSSALQLLRLPPKVLRFNTLQLSTAFWLDVAGVSATACYKLFVLLQVPNNLTAKLLNFSVNGRLSELVCSCGGICVYLCICTFIYIFVSLLLSFVVLVNLLVTKRLGSPVSVQWAIWGICLLVQTSINTHMFVFN